MLTPENPATMKIYFILIILYFWEVNGTPLNAKVFDGKSDEIPASLINKNEGISSRKNLLLEIRQDEDERDKEKAFALASETVARLVRDKYVTTYLADSNSEISEIKPDEETSSSLKNTYLRKTMYLAAKILRCEVESLSHHFNKCRRVSSHLPHNMNTDLVKKPIYRTSNNKFTSPNHKGFNNSTTSSQLAVSKGLGVTCNVTGNNCGECQSITEQGGIIQSPNYPQEYYNNLACVYVIEVPAGSRIRVSFTRFLVERDYDFISFFDRTGHPLRVMMDGYDIPSNVITKSNYVSMHFTSDFDNIAVPDNTIVSWAMTFTVLNPSFSTATSTQSPVITQPSTTTSTPVVESTTTGTTTTSTTTPPPPITTVSCQSECGSCVNVTQTEGYLRSPLYPDDYPEVRCTTIISVPDDQKIRIDFTEMVIEEFVDSLTIFNGNVKLKTLNGYTTPLPFIIKNNVATFLFESDSENSLIPGWYDYTQLGHWQLHFTVLPPTTFTTTDYTTTTVQTSTEAPVSLSYQYSTNCNGGIFFNMSESGGIIRSPNYPNEYPPDLGCDYILSFTGRKRVELHFDEFYVEEDYDALYIANGNDIALQSRLTGYTIPETVIVKENAVKVIFFSDEENAGIVNRQNTPRFQISFSLRVLPAPTTEQSTTTQSN